MTSTHPADPDQRSLDEVEPSLKDVTFVVVDLETTGGSAAAESITEIGAVKVRGGEELGEFATLVNPGRSIPPQIVMLTGITDAMVAPAPRIETVLPSFLEFSRGCVLVAHNARFDIGFLRAACARLEIKWPNPPVVDTVRLARSVFPRSEVPSVRLGILAPMLGARTHPDHRALHDARATVDVLHALLERLGPLGVVSLTELKSAERRVDPARRRKRHLADSVPAEPGVYLFRGADDAVLYVGTSRNLRARVRSYFTAAETRGRIKQMVMLAHRVDHVVCATALEARVRELRLIAAHRPPYNRRSKDPQKISWVRLTAGPTPRLTASRTTPAADEPALGPFTSLRTARQVIRTLGRVVGQDDLACLAELFEGRSDRVLVALRDRLEHLARAGRYAEAAGLRDELALVVQALITWQRLRPFVATAEVVAASPDTAGGWDLALMRHGRLAGAGRARRGVDPWTIVASITRTAETVLPRPGPLPAATAEESAVLLSFLERPDVRLVRISAAWRQPAAGAGRWLEFARSAAAARESAGEVALAARRQ